MMGGPLSLEGRKLAEIECEKKDCCVTASTNLVGSSTYDAVKKLLGMLRFTETIEGSINQV